MALTKTQMTSVIEDDIIDRHDKSTLVGFALTWALEYIDKTAAARGFAFSDLNAEEITTTTISSTCTIAADDLVTASIDIPTGTKIVFSTTDTLPDIACTFATTDVAISTDIITVSIDIPDTTAIIFTSTGTVPTGLTSGTTYYCLRQSATTIKVAATSGGAAIDITAVGSGTHTVTTSGGGLDADTDYWAVRQSSTTSKVAQTYLKAWQGTTIDITGAGTGTHTVTAYRERLAKPDSCRYIYDIRLIDGAMSRKLIAMPARRMDLFIPFASQWSVQRPTHYVEWKDWIQLYPIPDDTYIIKIRYYKWHTFSATDYSTVEYIDDIIISAAAMYVWKMLGEPEQAAIMEQAVEVSLAKCGKLERLKPDLILKPNMGSYARSDEDTQSDPFISSQR